MMEKIDNIKADVNLLYCIQRVTGHSTGKILGYFNSLALNIIEDHFVTKAKENTLRKTMKWVYADAIPFELYVFVSKGRYASHEVEIKPSKRMVRFNINEILDKEFEYKLGLEGAEGVGGFTSPILKAPNSIKKMLSGEKPKKTEINVNDLPPELRHMVK